MHSASFQKYVISPVISSDKRLKECIPIGYVVSEILLYNVTSNQVTVSISFDGDYTLPGVVIDADGYVVLNPSRKYYAKKSAYIELTSTNWNSSRIGVQLLLWKAT
jgi:hypothetical protein